MQRTLMQNARVLIASSIFGAAACASEVIPDVGDVSRSGSGGAGVGGTTVVAGGASGASGAAGAMSGQAGAGGIGGAAGSGGAGAEPPMGGGGAAGGAEGDAGNGGASSMAGFAGLGGASGATGSAGKGGGGAGGAGGGSAGAGGASGSAGASGSGGSGGGAVNLITNSGFETNASGWSVHGGGATISVVTAQAHSGMRSLMITGRTAAYQGPQYSVLSVVEPGASYTFSVWGRLAASTPTGSLTVTVHYVCDGGASDGDNYFRWVEATAASTSSWTELTAAHAFPSCAGTGTITAASIYVESPSANLSYYVDDGVLTAP